MSALRRTFSEGNFVERTTNDSVASVEPSFAKNAIDPGPGASFTETGMRPRKVPSGCSNMRIVRSFHFADATTARQVRRKVWPRFTDVGESEQSWAEAAVDIPNSARTARNEIHRK